MHTAKDQTSFQYSHPKKNTDQWDNIEVTQGLKHYINLANKLSIEECIAVVGGARLLIGVDTSLGHIAAATKTPSILIYSGINPIEHWSPKSALSTILIEKLPCYPCYRMRGCASMDCVQKITTEQMLEAIHAKLRHRKENDHRLPDHNAVFPCVTHET